MSIFKKKKEKKNGRVEKGSKIQSLEDLELRELENKNLVKCKKRSRSLGIGRELTGELESIENLKKQSTIQTKRMNQSEKELWLPE